MSYDYQASPESYFATRLYAVLAQDPKTGVLHLKDVEGHDTIIN